jgi:hypothetical protein
LAEVVSKCVGDVFYLDPAVANHGRDDIETNLNSPRALVGHPPGREPSQPPLFHGMNGLRRNAPAVGTARLYLAEDQHAAATEDEIDFTTRSPVVTLHNLESEPPVMPCCEILSGAAQRVARVHADRLGGGYDDPEL